MKGSQVTIDHVSKRFGDFVALDDINFTIQTVRTACVSESTALMPTTSTSHTSVAQERFFRQSVPGDAIPAHSHSYLLWLIVVGTSIEHIHPLPPDKD